VCHALPCHAGAAAATTVTCRLHKLLWAARSSVGTEAALPAWLLQLDCADGGGCGSGSQFTAVDHSYMSSIHLESNYVS